MTTSRVRLTANGVEVWDALKREWYPASSHTATLLLGNTVAPRSYRTSHPKGKVEGLSRVELRAGKGR